MKSVARQLSVLLLLATLVGATPSRSAPPFHEWERIRLAVLTWASGLVSGRAEDVAPVLHRRFKADVGFFFGDNEDKDQYLQRLAGRRMSAVIIRYAKHETVGDSVQVSPVVAEFGGGMFRVPITVTVFKEDDSWLIVSITGAPALPDAMTKAVLPEHFALHPVSVFVRDADTGEPIAARVHVRDGNGEYWPPAGHMKNITTGWNEDVGGNVAIDGKTYAYIEPDFTLPVPEGSYEMEVHRGLEYEPLTLRFEVAASTVPTIEVRLQRWSNMQAQGWYSGDTHVHFLDPLTMLSEMEGEDLNVINVLATKWGELITNVEHFTGGPSLLSEPEHIAYVNEETRHGFLGHTILLNLKRLVYPLTWGGPGEGVAGGYDYPPMAHQADKAHNKAPPSVGRTFRIPMVRWPSTSRSGKSMPSI